MRKRCDAMGLDESANANAKNFSHYHPWCPWCATCWTVDFVTWPSDDIFVLLIRFIGCVPTAFRCVWNDSPITSDNCRAQACLVTLVTMSSPTLPRLDFWYRHGRFFPLST
jgi:hypothetical protein